MRLAFLFWESPSGVLDIANDRPTAVVHSHMLDPDGLFTLESVSLQGFDLGGERARQLVEAGRRALLLGWVFGARKASCCDHGGVVDGHHLGCEQCLGGIGGCQTAHQ